ncbi:tRNA pseudouridine synthase A isoform X2 [Spodoptera litura]|uniref:Pseudouridylate synthase 1 homolog n=1 Tax=Spodoptera litura TaxID=69820 RepID=A0A9J7DR99_SPOLT|nr:tRNA pseudouridine synthase A isoform X2 [Spodoptera litura]
MGYYCSKLYRNKILPHVRSISAMEVATVEKVADDNQKESQEIVQNKNFTRFKQRFMKRQWQDPDPNKTENGESDEKKHCERPVERIKRKKMALVLGYCGVDYYGMQRNPGVRTIEEDLLKALMEAKYITEDDFNNQQNTQFQRSSRTDKGVSAARQVVSLKLPLEVDINEINKRLPDCIKVFGIKRVTNKFNSKSKCNARTYSYTLPTYVFEPSLVTDEERKQYRISEDKKEQVGKVLEVYKGTKSYHNFTEKKHHQDPSSLRYMMGFTLDRVFVDSEMEFAVLLVKGQSFMLHQIRKMVGLAIAVLRGHTDNSILEKAFGKEKVMIPTAPGLGLVLDTVHYDRYDNKFKDSHDSLTWTSEEEEIQKFKHEHIYPVIVKGEVENNSMALWLEKMSNHSYEPSEDVPEKIDEKELAAGGDDDDDIDEEDEGDDEKNDRKNSNTVVSTAAQSNMENGNTDKSGNL